MKKRTSFKPSVVRLRKTTWMVILHSVLYVRITQEAVISFFPHHSLTNPNFLKSYMFCLHFTNATTVFVAIFVFVCICMSFASFYAILGLVTCQFTFTSQLFLIIWQISPWHMLPLRYVKPDYFFNCFSCCITGKCNTFRGKWYLPSFTYRCPPMSFWLTGDAVVISW